MQCWCACGTMGILLKDKRLTQESTRNEPAAVSNTNTGGLLVGQETIDVAERLRNWAKQRQGPVAVQSKATDPSMSAPSQAADSDAVPLPSIGSTCERSMTVSAEQISSRQQLTSQPAPEERDHLGGNMKAESWPVFDGMVAVLDPDLSPEDVERCVSLHAEIYLTFKRMCWGCRCMWVRRTHRTQDRKHQ